MKTCYLCDNPIQRGDPKDIVDGLSVHKTCDPGALERTCDTEGCAWRWTTHAGGCVT